MPDRSWLAPRLVRPRRRVVESQMVVRWNRRCCGRGLPKPLHVV